MDNEDFVEKSRQLEDKLVEGIESKINNKEPIKEVERLFKAYECLGKVIGSVPEHYNEVKRKYDNYKKYLQN